MSGARAAQFWVEREQRAPARRLVGGPQRGSSGASSSAASAGATHATQAGSVSHGEPVASCAIAYSANHSAAANSRNFSSSPSRRGAMRPTRSASRAACAACTACIGTTALGGGASSSGDRRRRRERDWRRLRLGLRAPRARRRAGLSAAISSSLSSPGSARAIRSHWCRRTRRIGDVESRSPDRRGSFCCFVLSDRRQPPACGIEIARSPPSSSRARAPPATSPRSRAA